MPYKTAWLNKVPSIFGFCFSFSIFCCLLLLFLSPFFSFSIHVFTFSFFRAVLCDFRDGNL